jgi:hypothetical protein
MIAAHGVDRDGVVQDRMRRDADVLLCSAWVVVMLRADRWLSISRHVIKPLTARGPAGRLVPVGPESRRLGALR